MRPQPRSTPLTAWVVKFNRSVMSDSLQAHGLWYARPPCPSSTPAVYSNSCPLSWWCHPTVSSSIIPTMFPSIRVFSNESVLHIRWPKYWSFSFSISPSNAYSGLISFRMNWLDFLAVQGTLKSLLLSIGWNEWSLQVTELVWDHPVHGWCSTVGLNRDNLMPCSTSGTFDNV